MGNKITMWSPALVLVVVSAKENYSNISENYYLRCTKTTDNFTCKDRPFVKEATGLGHD